MYHSTTHFYSTNPHNYVLSQQNSLNQNWESSQITQYPIHYPDYHQFDQILYDDENIPISDSDEILET